MTASSGEDTGQEWPNNPEEQMLPGALTGGIQLGKVPFVLMFKRLYISFFFIKYELVGTFCLSCWKNLAVAESSQCQCF